MDKIYKILNFFSFDAARPLINKEAEEFLHNLREEDYEEKINNIKNGESAIFQTGNKQIRLKLVKDLEVDSD